MMNDSTSVELDRSLLVGEFQFYFERAADNKCRGITVG
jgi:hypothetical protein